MTTPNPDLRGPLSRPKALASIPRPRDTASSSVSLPPSFSSPNASESFPRSPRTRKDLGRNFRRHRPTSPSAGAPGRQPASSSRKEPPGRRPAGAGCWGGGTGAARGEGAGGREGKGHSPWQWQQAPAAGWSGGGAAAGMVRGSAGLGSGQGLPAQHRTVPARRLPPARAARQREGGKGAGGEAAPRTGHTGGHTPAPLPGAAPPPAPPRRPLSASPSAPRALPARLPPSASAQLGPSRRAVLVCSPGGRPPAGRGVCYGPGGLRASPRVSPGGGMWGTAASPLMSENAFIVAL